MFDFALWDARRRRLLIGRDRLGVKPLYVLQDGNVLAFATEAKALLALPGVQARAEPRGADRLPATGLRRRRRGRIFKGIRKLPPATLLAVEGGQVREWRYWRLPQTIDTAPNEAQWVERVRAQLEQSVRMQMVSDVPIGAFLSRRRRLQRGGGVHGQALTSSRSAPMRSVSTAAPPRRCTTSCRTPGKWRNAFGTEHHEIVVKPDVVGLLPRLLWHMDEPLSDSAFITTYLVSEFARQRREGDPFRRRRRRALRWLSTLPWASTTPSVSPTCLAGCGTVPATWRDTCRPTGIHRCSTSCGWRRVSWRRRK